MLRAAAAALLALALAAPASAALPRRGVLVPAQRLGGLELGATQAEVEQRWGARFGRCRSCKRPTWYFNYRSFDARGAGVEFRAGRAVALFTVWSPQGWRTSRGVVIGDPAARITSVYGPLTRVECGDYYALTMRARRATTAFYVWDEKVWGFGISAPRVPVCRS